MDNEIKIQRPVVSIVALGNSRFTYEVHSYNEIYTRTANGTDRKAVETAARKFEKLYDKVATDVETGPKRKRYYIMEQFEDNGFFTKRKALRVDATGI
jgi:hypothetical protein